MGTHRSSDASAVRFPWATIDAAALRHNLGVARRFAPNSKVVAVIKANAYGHGIVTAARVLDDADAFGVARIEEALVLREANIVKPIVLFEGVFSASDLEVAAQQALQVVVHDMEQLRMLEVSGNAKRFDVWLKIDTGMNRLGFRPEEFDAVWRRLQSLGPHSVRLMTHLVSAELPGAAETAEQLARFHSIAKGLPIERSAANSAGIVASEAARCDWVRPGLMLYGISPVTDRTATELGLRPVMTLRTRLIAIRRVPAGETVGYNGIWRAERDSIVGIAAIGYGDGYPRNIRSGTPVLVNGRETQVVGRVSMDMTAIDLTDLNAQISDLVTLWGEGLSADRVAPYAGTIAYELLCGLNRRVNVEWTNV
jgi:alanine racemase